MMIEIYTKPTCKTCNQLKQYLTEKEISYSEYSIGECITREEVIKRFPGIKMVPIVVINGIHVGGTNELMEYVEKGNIDEELYVRVQKDCA